jgi:hypothetical protein
MGHPNTTPFHPADAAGLVDQVTLPLGIQHVHFDRQGAAQNIQQGPNRFFAFLRRTNTQDVGRFHSNFGVAVNAVAEATCPQFRFAKQPIVPQRPSYSKRRRPQSSRLGAVTRQPRFKSRRKIVDHTAECVIGGVACWSAYIGIGGVVVKFECHGFEYRAGQLPVG